MSVVLQIQKTEKRQVNAVWVFRHNTCILTRWFPEIMPVRVKRRRRCGNTETNSHRRPRAQTRSRGYKSLQEKTTHAVYLPATALSQRLLLNHDHAGCGFSRLCVIATPDAVAKHVHVHCKHSCKMRSHSHMPELILLSTLFKENKTHSTQYPPKHTLSECHQKSSEYQSLWRIKISSLQLGYALKFL